MPADVRLRAVEDEDLDVIAAYLQHPESWGRRGIKDDRPGPMSGAAIRKAIEEWTAPEHGTVLVVEGVMGPVGHVKVDIWWDAASPTVDVVIAPDVRRRGFGRAAAEALLDQLFSATVAHVAICWIDDWNDAGLRFAGSLGFTEAGRIRRTGVRDGRYHGAAAFDLLRREWEESRAARG